MRETTMKRNTTFSVLTLGVAVLLAGCSTQSPTAPKNPGAPTQGTPATGLSVTLTATPNPAAVNEIVLVVAQVNSGSGNAPDNTAVTFLVSGGVFPVGVDTQGNTVTATSVVRTTSSGRAAVNVTSAVAGQVIVEARVAGGNAVKTITFQAVVGPTPTPVPGVGITSVSPSQGAPQGGDRVVIPGRGFVQPLTVNFVVAGKPYPATVNFVATDGTAMTVTTPDVTTTPPATVDQKADVVVAAGEYSDTLKGGFTFLAQSLTPQMYTITPNAGPFEGGTPVVITGTGFQYPVQVLFGTRQAQVNFSNYTEVDCIAPSITPEGPNSTTTVNVTVKNVTNGNISNALQYVYGGTMYISGFTPTEGSADASTTVTIFGQGFVAPVSVIAVGGGAQFSWNPTDVSGTTIIATAVPIPASARTCDDLPVTLTVTNLGSNTHATATQQFTYRAVRPLITSVDVDTTGNNQVTQYNPPTCGTTPWTSHTVTIHGSGFQASGGVSAMTVSFGNLQQVPTTFVDANTLTLTLPDLTGIPINHVDCNDGSGPGLRDVATPISVTLFNLRNGCNDSLGGGIVIVPCDTTCRLITPPTLAVTSTTPLTVSAAGTLPTNVSFTVAVTPAQAATLNVNYSGDSIFSGAPATVNTNASGIGTLTLTVMSGVTDGQSATATISYLTATPVTATVNIGP
jgi:hypothetical protein